MPVTAAAAPPVTAGDAPGSAPPTLHLITWDIDGTLLRATGDRANALHRSSFTRAWETVLGRALDLASIPHQGSTDPLILIKGAVSAGLAECAADLMGQPQVGGASAVTPPTADPASPLAKMVEEMLAYFEAGAATVADGLELLPGVADLLAALAAREDVLVGLVTGNLAPIAYGKVKALGVASAFTPGIGGFGSDHCSGNWEEPWHDRAELVRIAVTKAGASLAGGPHAGRPLRVAHLGDTPFDCLAAAAAGATPVGVATGVHSRTDLEGAVPGVVVLDDLSDTAAALRALGL